MVGAAFTTLLVSNSRERHSTRLAQQSQQVVAAADRLERLVLQIEASERGFALTRERRFLAQWEAARRDFPGASSHFVGLAAVRAHDAAARAIVATAGSYIRDYSIPLVNRARRSTSGVRKLIAARPARQLEASLRTQLGRFASSERGFVAGRERRARDDAQTAKAAAIAGLAGSIALVFLFGAYLSRAIVAPIRRTATMAGRLAAGDLATRVPETGPGEIGDLEHAFNAMGESLEVSGDGLRHLADEQAALRRVATLVARDVPSRELLTAVVREVDRVLGASSTRLARYGDNDVTVIISSGAEDEIPVSATWPIDGDHIAGSVYRTGRVARRDSSAGVTGYLGEELRKMGVRSAIGAPIVVNGRLWGTMVPYWTDHDPPPDIESRLTQFTDLIATAIANGAARAELTASRARVVASADEARRRIERDLHDGAQQRLVHAVITLKLARRELGEHDGPAAQLVDEALQHAESANAALRELVHGILPAALAHGGLRAGIKALVARAPLPVSVAVTAERLPPTLEATAYFIAAEALTNVIKHAHATRADVEASVTDGALRIEVRDDGAGGARLEGSSGLIGLRDRAEALEGKLTVNSPVGGGTVVAATLPVPAPPAEQSLAAAAAP